jgi:hypothetical protein
MCRKYCLESNFLCALKQIMSFESELLSTGFWQQQPQLAVPQQTTSMRYGLAPQPPRLTFVPATTYAPPVRSRKQKGKGKKGEAAVPMEQPGGHVLKEPVLYGRLRTGQYAECSSNILGLCGPVDPQTGRELPPVKCNPPKFVYNCYYEGTPAPRYSALSAAMSSEPFQSAINTVYSQPNYADATQTFFASIV